MVLGTPDKVISYKGIHLRLYKASVLRKLIQRKYKTFLKFEDAGAIPRPMFVAGNKRYYCAQELYALSEVMLQVGPMPRPNSPKSKEWTETLQSKWASIRTALQEGDEPALPILIRFDSRKELEIVLKSLLRPAGISSDIYVQGLAEKLMNFQTV